MTNAIKKVGDRVYNFGIWKSILVLLLGAMISVGGWSAANVAGFSSKFLEVSKFEWFIARQDKNFESRLCSLRDYMQENQKDLERRIDETNIRIDGINSRIDKTNDLLLDIIKNDDDS